MNTPEEFYQQELAQAEIDHHTPTAGAMIGHIISNLVIQQNKLRQSIYYAAGEKRAFIVAEFSRILSEENKLVDQLNWLMLDEGEIVPTTTQEFTQYSMLTEDGRLKYESADKLIFATVKDFDTQNLFITRGIALAEKENKYALASFLQELYGWLKHQIFIFQKALGHQVTEGLLADEDDDDE